jgi:hypothetical protein
MVMTSAQVARAAAQLHEAAQDVARVAALRGGQAQELVTELPVPRQSEFTKRLDDRMPDARSATVLADGQDA